MNHKVNYFESHPKKTILVILVSMAALIYVLFSVKWINGAITEFEKKNLKTIIHQYIVGKIIDANIGRFIKLREYRPLQTFMDRPSKNYMKNVASHTLERKYYCVQTDEHGFIMPSAVHEQPDYKIVFLGGSTTECLYMAPQERFPYLVGRLIEETTQKKINSYNGGVSANESMHSINILINKVLALEPHMVVMMHNINDLLVLRNQGTYWYANSLKSHVQTSKNVFTRYQFPPLKDFQFVEEKIVQEFSRNLSTFIAICRIRNIQPVLMTQANRLDLTADPLYHRFNDIIREIGNKEQVLVIDLAKAIPPTTEYLYDTFHYTAKGANLAAQEIANHLKNNLMFNS